MHRVAAAASVLALVGAQLSAAPTRGQTQPVACPVLAGEELQLVDVFDGSPAEQAYLVPDSTNDEGGVWRLGYVFDAGRFVTVRCKYTHGHAIDLTIATRVARCQYTSQGAAGLKMVCQ
jgi:hypothetical protein